MRSFITPPSRAAIANALLFSTLFACVACVKVGPNTSTPPRSSDTIASVWAVGDGEKVKRDDLTHPARYRNSAWDGKSIRLFGARNEIVSFQIIVEAGRKGIDALSLRLPELVSRDLTTRIVYRPPGTDPTHWVDRPIELFSEHYMRIDRPTCADWMVVPCKIGAPTDMMGDKPVQLVPENARPGRGGFPVQVEARKNQAFWVDIYLEKNLPAGHYDGVVTVDADGASRPVPIDLEVLDFTLPDEAETTYMIYYREETTKQYHGKNLDARYHRFAHRNRVEFVQAYDIAAMKQYAGRFDGSDFTAGVGYEGPGAGVGNRMAPRTFWDPGTLFDDPVTAEAEANAWMTYLEKNFPRARTLLYMPDEPGWEQFDRIRHIADNIHKINGPGKDLPIFITHAYTKELAGAIDIWATVASQYKSLYAAQERLAGREMIYYNGQRSWVGANVIDTPATDPRVHGWATFKAGIPLYFYWHANHWYHNQNAPATYERNQNVWAAPLTFVNRLGEFGNGDGVLVYPGEEKLHPGQDRAIEGPISTIQMANLRRGAQDNLYLLLARRCGREDVVREAIAAVVPAILDETGSEVGFAERGDTFEGARRLLADAIVNCLRKH